ncbi:MAG TPA: CDP-alcohol phosphatidyltransferase family protein [Candidatus Limnocylindrales bacterium]|nr:CDP-alcohol phosphatidyltransferase family protein [Candidatus Limnocylindrales bacterium]
MGSLVSPTLRARIRGAAEPVARLFGRVGLTPNALTLIGFGMAIAAAYAAASHAWLAAGLLVAFGAAFDLLDGALARATNTASRFGAFMDSTFDRAGEAVVYIGIAIAYYVVPNVGGGGVLLPMAAMAAALMVSYTRAKAESLGFASGKGLASVGFAPREVRVVILAVGLVLTDLGGGLGEMMWPTAGSQFLFLSLGLITLLATVTTIQRIVHVYLQSKKEP